MPTVHERELFTDPPLHTRAHNVKGTVMVGRVADFSESTASKIHKRGNVDTLLADDYGDYHPPSGRSRNIVLKNILGLSCALIASRSVGPEYDCFIIRSSSRTWKTSDVFFFSPLSFSLFRALLLSRVSCYIIVLLPSNYYAPLGELRSFPIPLWLDKQARFLNASLVSRGSLLRLAFEIRSSPLERWNLVYFSIGEFRISSLESHI